MDYDLSQVFFITTANSLHSIPLPLQDRMEIIRLPGYLETEKMHIAKSFLLPKQVEAHGLKDSNEHISDPTMLDVLRSYNSESGVRNIERELAAVCRKVAMQLVETDQLDKTVQVTCRNLPGFLGIKKYRFGERESGPQIGGPPLEFVIQQASQPWGYLLEG